MRRDCATRLTGCQVGVSEHKAVSRTDCPHEGINPTPRACQPSPSSSSKAIANMSTHWRGPSPRNGRGRAHYLRSNIRRGGLARRASPAPELPDPPSGSLLATIHREDIIDTHPSPDDNNNHKITNCTVLASYNWLNRKSPTITVPGKYGPPSHIHHAHKTNTCQHRPPTHMDTTLRTHQAATRRRSIL